MHPVSPVQAEFLSETIEMWDPQIFRNKAWNWVSCECNVEVSAVLWKEQIHIGQNNMSVEWNMVTKAMCKKREEGRCIRD